MTPKVKAFLQAWLINTVAVLTAAHVVDGISYDTAVDLIVATLLLGVLNAFVRPLLLLLSLPLLLFTLGLFTLVINAGLLWFVGELVKGFHVATFWSACKAALLIAIINLLLNGLTRTGESRFSFSHSIRRKRGGDPTPKPPVRGPDDKGGPMIDV